MLCRVISCFFDYSHTLVFHEAKEIGVWNVPSQITSSLLLVIFHETSNKQLIYEYITDLNSKSVNQVYTYDFKSFSKPAERSINLRQ